MPGSGGVVHLLGRVPTANGERMNSAETPDDWFVGCEHWQAETRALRTILLGAGLAETLKWQQPCYTDQGKNIALVSERKSGAILSLIKGALLDDPAGRLVRPGEARSGRYLLFTSVEQVLEDQAYLEALLAQAVAFTRAGRRVEPLSDELVYTDELAARLSRDAALRGAFEALTLGRRRGYNLYFGKAKKAKTREDRITRYTPRILMGKGMLDCVCGHSNRPPGCDGSHKQHPGSRAVD